MPICRLANLAVVKAWSHTSPLNQTMQRVTQIQNGKETILRNGVHVFKWCDKNGFAFYCMMCCTLCCFANLHTFSYHIIIQNKNCTCIFRYQALGPNQWYEIYISCQSLPGLCVCLQCKSFTTATNSHKHFLKEFRNGPLPITHKHDTQTKHSFSTVSN